MRYAESRQKGQVGCVVASANVQELSDLCRTVRKSSDMSVHGFTQFVDVRLNIAFDDRDIAIVWYTTITKFNRLI